MCNGGTGMYHLAAAASRAEMATNSNISVNFGRLTVLQSDRLRQFWHTHNNLHGSYNGGIGGRYSWIITLTSLGTVVKVQCTCGDLINLTSYEDWDAAGD